MRIFTALFFTIISISSLHAKITPELEDQIFKASPNEMISCIVVMKTTYPFEDMRSESVKTRIHAYRSIAWESQQPLINWLSARSSDAQVHKQFWVLNGFYLKAKPQVILEIAKRGDVGTIFHNAEVKIIPVSSSTAQQMSRAVEWGVLKIQADKCWDEGYTGEGVIIGIVDTGVDYKHPALQGKWSGHWFVASGLPQQTTPYDDNKHGTHCMGTMVGGDGRGSFENDIGIAPGAKFAAAKGLNGGGSGSSNQLIECLQFMADLKDTVDIKAVSNSWGSSKGGEQAFWDVFKTLLSIGIVPLAANGNNGSQGAGSVASPGDYPHVIGVGATDIDDKIASFSSLGPTVQTSPWDDKANWLRDDWNYIKPNISAPGVNIRSSTPNGEYGPLNGTSMATPHVCGAVALLFQKNVNLTPTMVYNLLLDNVDKPSAGGTYPNNTFGWGRLNIYKALQATPTMNQPWVYVTEKKMDKLEPGKSVDLVVTVKNLGGANADKTTANFFSMDNYVTLKNISYAYGNLQPKQAASNTGSPVNVAAHATTPQGHTAMLGIILHADGVHDSLDFDDTITFAVTVGESPAPQKIFNEDFEYSGGVDSFSIIWEKSGNWNRVDNVAQSPTHSLYSGAIIDGKVYCTMKTGVDLSSFKKVYLSHYTKYNFDNPFWCSALVEISSDGGSKWNAVWNSPRNSFVDSIPWTQQMSDISPYMSNNVKFRVNLESKSFFQKYNHWYIDDIEIFVDTDNEPPYFANTTLWHETNLTGPFAVQSTITDASGIKEAGLYYRVNSGSWQKLALNSSGSDQYQASIPAQTGTGTISYYLEATDTWFLTAANKGTFPIGAGQSAGYHSFVYGSTGIVNNPQAVRFDIRNANQVNGLVSIGFRVPDQMQVKLSCFDVMGREVATLLDSKVKKGDHRIVWNRKDHQTGGTAAGVYFIRFSAEPLTSSAAVKSFRKIERIMLIQ